MVVYLEACKFQLPMMFDDGFIEENKLIHIVYVMIVE
jgi:hypothetical protein